MLNSSSVIMRTLAFLPNPLIAIGSNSVLGGLNVIYTAIAVNCAACMDINKGSRVNIGGKGPAPPPQPGFYAYAP